jgi:hypothetical protein
VREIITLFDPHTTRWLLVANGEDAGSMGCPDGKRFAPGDHVTLPRQPRRTPAPDRGVSWHIAAVEEAPGWDGRLILDDPRLVDDPQ